MYILCEASGKPASCYSSGGDGDEVSRMMGRRKAAVYQGRAATMSSPPSERARRETGKGTLQERLARTGIRPLPKTWGAAAFMAQAPPCETFGESFNVRDETSRHSVQHFALARRKANTAHSVFL